MKAWLLPGALAVAKDDGAGSDIDIGHCCADKLCRPLTAEQQMHFQRVAFHVGKFVERDGRRFALDADMIPSLPLLRAPCGSSRLSLT